MFEDLLAERGILVSYEAIRACPRRHKMTAAAYRQKRTHAFHCWSKCAGTLVAGTGADG